MSNLSLLYLAHRHKWALSAPCCRRSAHLALLTLSVYVVHFRTIIYYIHLGELFEHHRSESRSDIRWYSAVHTIPNTTHQCHVVCCQITCMRMLRVKWFLHIILDYPFDSINQAYDRLIKYTVVWEDPVNNALMINIRAEHPYLKDSTIYGVVS
jgi:hypothetical protein